MSRGFGAALESACRAYAHRTSVQAALRTDDELERDDACVDRNSAAMGDSLDREYVLGRAFEFRAWAVDGNRVVLCFPGHEKIWLSRESIEGCPVVWFDGVSKAGACARRVRFWMNASSVASLGAAMRAAPEKRVEFAAVVANVGR